MKVFSGPNVWCEFLVFAFYHGKLFKPNLFFFQEYVHLGENIFIHCSRITIIHIQVNVFSLNFAKRVNVTQTESNQEVTKK